MKLDLRGCPWCGKIPEVNQHYTGDSWSLVHRCKVMGYLGIDWTSDPKMLEKIWNTKPKEKKP